MPSKQLYVVHEVLCRHVSNAGDRVELLRMNMVIYSLL